MVLYDTIDGDYATLRRPDHRIAALINRALGDAASVVNIGAGTGSYEPSDRDVLAIEPSEVMIRQRPRGAARCIQASAEALPLASASFDAAMAVLTMHHWTDLERGLREMARVARRRVVLVTWVPDAAPFWLTADYFPEIYAYDRSIFPSSDVLTKLLERTIGPTNLEPVPIPHDCTDGFLCSYWRRPESYLDSRKRGAISSFARIDVEPGLTKLRADLSSGRWNQRNAALRTVDAIDAGYRIACCEVRNSGVVPQA